MKHRFSLGHARPPGFAQTVSKQVPRLPRNTNAQRWHPNLTPPYFQNGCFNNTDTVHASAWLADWMPIDNYFISCILFAFAAGYSRLSSENHGPQEADHLAPPCRASQASPARSWGKHGDPRAHHGRALGWCSSTASRSPAARWGWCKAASPPPACRTSQTKGGHLHASHTTVLDSVIRRGNIEPQLLPNEKQQNRAEFYSSTGTQAAQLDPRLS